MDLVKTQAENLFRLFIISSVSLTISSVTLGSSKKPSPEINLNGENAPVIQDPSQLKRVSIVNSKGTFQKVDLKQTLNLNDQDPDFKKFLDENQAIVGAFNEINKNEQSVDKILAELNKWNPSSDEFKIYKQYFSAIWQNNVTKMQELYLQLKANKKFIRLRLELVMHLIRNAKLDQGGFDYKKFITREARVLLKQLNGTSEAEFLESEYLSWLYKNKIFSEICRTERNRWISEPTIEFVDLTLATESCPVDFSEFLTRIRRLLFAAKDYQALREIELYAKQFKLADWQKAYALSVYHSLSGDPATGFQNLAKYENEVMKSDYDINYFYIAQRAGELDKAEKIMGTLLKNTKNAKQLQELKFQKAFLFYQVKKYAEAHDIFDSLYKAKKIRKSKKKIRVSKDFDQIAWLRAWTSFLNKDYVKALKEFSETIPYAHDEARLLYWISETHRLMGSDFEAAQGFKKLASPFDQEKPFTFYNLLAWLRLSQMKKDVKLVDNLKTMSMNAKSNRGQYAIPSDEMSYSEIKDLYQNFDSENLASDEGEIQITNSDTNVLDNVEVTGVNTETDQKLKDHINWAKLLLTYNEADLAKWHLYEIEKNINSKSRALILAQFYNQTQFYHRALSLMNRFGIPNKINLQLQSDQLVWTSLYPEAYKNIVQSYAQKYKLDPYLILSIMRAETQYKSDAISPVGAVGLMQFMPYSAQKVASLIDDSIETEHLFTPEKSVQYGAVYLKKLSIEMNQQKPLIAAAYNGGPHRVKSWLKNLGPVDFDVFIEHIPFAETRTYVKRVLTYNATYEKLYKNQIEVQKYKYLLNPVDFDYKQNMLTLREEWDSYRTEIKKLKQN